MNKEKANKWAKGVKVVLCGSDLGPREKSYKIEEIAVELLKTGVMMVKEIGGNALSPFTPLRVLKTRCEEKDTLDAAAGKK
jgi:hypothetical protein